LEVIHIRLGGGLLFPSALVDDDIINLRQKDYYINFFCTAYFQYVQGSSHRHSQDFIWVEKSTFFFF